MKGEFLSLETAELLHNHQITNVNIQLDESEYEAKINDILDNYMDKINEMIINDENEFIIKLLLQRLSKALEYIGQQKPLSVDETRQKEQLKLAYKNSDIFKTLCHLEDLEIAIWELKDILERSLNGKTKN